MFTVEQQAIIDYMKNTGRTSKEKKPIEECNIPIFSAKQFYRRLASDPELSPFETATRELIETGVLRGARNIGSVFAQIYYLDLNRIND